MWSALACLSKVTCHMNELQPPEILNKALVSKGWLLSLMFVGQIAIGEI